MHSCPICSQACYCNGDVDDIDAGDAEAELYCVHCQADALGEEEADSEDD